MKDKKPIARVDGPDSTMIELDRPTKTAKRINKIVLIALAVITIGIGIMLAWAWQSSDVLDIKKLPIPTRIIQDSTTGSAVVVLDVDFCKKVNAEGSLRTSFVSSTREIFLPLSRERSPEGCRRAELPVVIPKDLVADIYKIRLRATYDINPLKQGVIEEFESAPITIDLNHVQ